MEKSRLSSSKYEYQYRSGLTGLESIFYEGLLLTENHISLLRKTPFWLLIQPFYIASQTPHLKSEYSQYRKSNNVITQVLYTYDVSQKMFKLGDSYIPFNSNDIRLIFGVEQIGLVPIILENFEGNSTFRQRCFGHHKRFNTSSIKSSLLVACKGETLEDELDVARIFSLFVLCSIFLTSSSQALDYRFCDVVEDIECLKQYDWCKFLSDSFCEELNSNEASLWKSQGCTIGLLFWLCEHTTLIKRSGDFAIPRFVQWNLINLCDKLAKDSSMLMQLSSDQVVFHLIPTIEEQQMFFNVGDEFEQGHNDVQEAEEVDEADEVGDEFEQQMFKNVGVVGEAVFDKKVVEDDTVIALKDEIKFLKKQLKEHKNPVSTAVDDQIFDIMEENKFLDDQIVKLKKKIKVLKNQVRELKDRVSKVEHKDTKPKTKNLQKFLKLSQAAASGAGCSSSKRSSPPKKSLRRSSRNLPKKLKIDGPQNTDPIILETDSENNNSS